jgi:hypothetical protein
MAAFSNRNGKWQMADAGSSHTATRSREVVLI